MTPNDGSLYHYSCSEAMMLPIVNEFTWPKEVRATLYLIGMIYCFLGIAIITGTLMDAIEKITSSTRRVRLKF
jgi:solute carrier family 8 (sodium/calcium exchanger)